MAEPGNGDDPATNGAGSPQHWTPFSITTAVAIPLLADMQLFGTQEGKHIEVDVTGSDAFTYTVRDSYMHIVRASKASNWRQAVYVDDQKTATYPYPPARPHPGRLHAGSSGRDSRRRQHHPLRPGLSGQLPRLRESLASLSTGEYRRDMSRP